MLLSARVFSHHHHTDLDMDTLEIRHLGGKSTDFVDRTRWHLIFRDDTVRDGDPVIVFTERRSLVDNTSTRGGFNVRVTDYSEGLVLEL